jgi:serine/threonine protein kinase
MHNYTLGIKIIKGKTIGEGTFAKVKEAIHNPTKERVAIKIIKKNKINEKEDI